MSPLEIKLLKCIREYRRLSNQTVQDAQEVSMCHREADALLALEPELDDKRERYDAPFRVEHRAFVNRLFRRQ